MIEFMWEQAEYIKCENVHENEIIGGRIINGRWYPDSKELVYIGTGSDGAKKFWYLPPAGKALYLTLSDDGNELCLDSALNG